MACALTSFSRILSFGMGWFQIGAPLRRCPEKPAIDRSMRRHGPRNARGKGGNAMLINRRQALIGSVGAAAGLTIIPAFGQVPALKKKDSYKVGFAQTESNNPWRLAQTASMKDEAAKRGAQLVYTDAAGSAAKQVADVNSMIAQGVDFIFLPPREEKPLIPAVMNAKKAGIPVLLVDRSVDPSLAKPGVDYLAFIGSTFVLEGQRVADWTMKQTGGKGKSSSSKARSAPRPPTTARRASTRRSRPRRPTWSFS